MIRLAVIPVVLCLLLLAVRPALGQTPPPPPGPAPAPTSTPVPSGTPAPGAMATLRQMHAALVAAGTLAFHFRTRVVAVEKRQVDMTTDGIAALTPNSVHQVTTAVYTRLDRSPHTSVMERSELEALGHRAAWRVPHMAWQCESVPVTNLNSQLVALELRPLTAQVVGTDSIAGTPDTRVSARGTLYPWTGNQVDTVEVDVAQATGLPLRITSTFHTRLNGSTAMQSLTETYTKFGAAVRIRVPKACK